MSTSHLTNIVDSVQHRTYPSIIFWSITDTRPKRRRVNMQKEGRGRHWVRSPSPGEKQHLGNK